MRKLIIPLLVLVSLIGLASAGFVVTLDPEGILTNASIKDTQLITYGALVNDSNLSSGFTCYLYTTESGSSGPGTFTNVQTVSSVNNDTAFNFTARNDVAETSGALYNWAVNCSSSEGEQNWSSLNNDLTNGNQTFGVDVTAPSITVTAPTNNQWFNNNNSEIFNLLPIDDNAATCLLNTNINISTDNVGEFSIGTYTDSFDSVDYTNNTAFNFSRINDTGDVNFTDTNAGYKWEYSCNDTAGNVATLGSNYTFYMDTLAPTAFSFNSTLFKTDNVALWNATTATDYTPNIGWGITTETNFSRYEIFFHQTTMGSSTFVDLNITTRTTLQTNMSTLSGDQTYWINITAFDLAGNKRQMTDNGWRYGTDSTNRALKAGWNIIGNVGNNYTLSHLLNWSGASTVSVWNSSHSFQSYTGIGANGGIVVESSMPALLYLASDTTFSDAVWNISSHDNLVNLTNQTASDWNLVMNENYSTDYQMYQLDNTTNDCPTEANCVFNNVTYFSLFNSSAATGSKYMPFVNNWTIANTTNMEFGVCSWMFIGDGDVNNIQINWGNLSLR